MTTIALGGYRPRHRRAAGTTAIATLTLPALMAMTFAAVAVGLYYLTRHPVDCTHWVNPDHLGWPHSVCQVQTRHAPAWWHGTEPQP